jgi:hypothetical protein
MPRPLTNAEMVALQEDTNYLNADIPVWGSRVLIWTQANNMPVLIYHTADMGYVTTDISDLGQSVIDQLAQQSEVHGMWYYLPQSIEDVLTEKAESIETAAKNAGLDAEAIVKQVATTLGQTIGDIIKPVIDPLIVPLILGVAVAVIYFTKKG